MTQMEGEERRADQRDPQTYAIIGAAMEVHRELGPGFLEHAYHEALMVEFERRRIPYEHEKPVVILYKGKELNTPYRANLLCYADIIIEVKAQRALTDIDRGQTIHYLKATEHTRALLINFDTSSLQWERVVN
jgi:GxxExxY protein